MGYRIVQVLPGQTTFDIVRIQQWSVGWKEFGGSPSGPNIQPQAV